MGMRSGSLGGFVFFKERSACEMRLSRVGAEMYIRDSSCHVMLIAAQSCHVMLVAAHSCHVMLVAAHSCHVLLVAAHSCYVILVASHLYTSISADEQYGVILYR